MLNGRISLLLFTNSTTRGGAEEHMLMLARGLDSNLFQTHFACPPALAERVGPDLPATVEMIPIDLSRPTQWGPMIRFGRMLQARKVDILHSHLFCSSLLASPVGRLSGAPIIVETPHLREAWRKGWIKGRFFIDRFVGRFVDHYCAVSQANARYLIGEKRLPSRKIRVIHHACDLRRFSPAHRAPEGLRASLGMSGQEPLLVVAGRLEPQKGHSFLLEALICVRKEFPNVRLVCLGEGSLRAELERQIRTLGLEQTAYLLGYCQDVQDWLAAADVAVLPSLWEGFPGAALEALACERPLVATAVDGTPEVVIDGETGLTVPPGQPAPLGEAICRLLRDPERARELGKNGRQWVLENFTVDHLVGNTQKFYLEIWDRWLQSVRSRGGLESGIAPVRTTVKR
jgi:glycosyltransferase involved in cell wall biosynthesis